MRMQLHMHERYMVTRQEKTRERRQDKTTRQDTVDSSDVDSPDKARTCISAEADLRQVGAS